MINSRKTFSKLSYVFFINWPFLWICMILKRWATSIFHCVRDIWCQNNKAAESDISISPSSISKTNSKLDKFVSSNEETKTSNEASCLDSNELALENQARIYDPGGILERKVPEGKVWRKENDKAVAKSKDAIKAMVWSISSMTLDL